MYTFLINDDNTLTASIVERVMERSKLVSTLHFLADQTWNNIDLSDCVVMMEYLLPVSKRYKTEILSKSDELYKNKLEYKLPFDTNMTSEPGDIQMWLTFVKVSMDETGTTMQQVRKVGPGVIHIIPISNWADIIPDDALSPLDQRLIAFEAMHKAMMDQFNQNLANKADNITYDDEHRLRLTSEGKPIGNAIKITNESVETEDGSMRVVPF